MEMCRTKKIHCLVCNKILEVDYEEVNFDRNQLYVKCGCENRTSLDNYFPVASENSTISALDKTKVKFQVLEDGKWGKKGDWVFVRPPENENTPKFSRWVGQTPNHTIVVFETEESMTPNSCRQLLKAEEVFDEKSGERVYHFWHQYDEKMRNFIDEIIKDKKGIVHFSVNKYSKYEG